MTNWYVKDLSKLTGVSVQTLHHYDRIDLLKPSLRLPNGYRVYDEKDLLSLQQIIALKFLGFELSQIKALFLSSTEALEHFSVQAKLLEQKAKKMLDASDTLKQIVSGVKDDKSIPWETVIQLIEVYRMTQQLEHSWVKEIYTTEELKQYASFESELKSKSTAKQKAAFEQSWKNLVQEIELSLNQDPNSKTGITIGKKCLEWLNGVYGKKYAHLRTKKLEKGFAEGKGLEEVGLTPDTVAWMDKALDAYLRDRVYNILNMVETEGSNEKIFKLWTEVLDDIYGDDEVRKKELLDKALADDKVSKLAKAWLKTLQE